MARQQRDSEGWAVAALAPARPVAPILWLSCGVPHVGIGPYWAGPSSEVLAIQTIKTSKPGGRRRLGGGGGVCRVRDRCGRWETGQAASHVLPSLFGGRGVEWNALGVSAKPERAAKGTGQALQKGLE